MLFSVLAVAVAVGLPTAEAASPVALVELFTSEGCSGCPAAEQVLAELANDAEADGVPVTPLALHVTAWDRLGWRDPFGLEAADARHAFYGETLAGGKPYTPMMVINGQVAFVGSDRVRARMEVLRVLLEPATASVTVKQRPAPPDGIDVEVAIKTEESESLVAQAALVQRTASSVVGAGETAGQTLHHARVVRALAVAPVEAQRARLRLSPAGGLASGDGVSVVVWVQRASDLRVVGVVEQPLASRASTAGRGPPLLLEPPRALRP